MINWKKAYLGKDVVMMGSDPEIFVTDGDKLLPAFEFLPPKECAKWENIDSGYFPEEASKLFWDGFQAEWEFKNPYFCMIELMHGIRGSLKAMEQKAKAKFPNAKLSLQSVFRIPKDVMDATPEPFAALGCMPSYNAYRKSGLKVNDYKEFLDRSTGGHLHFGARFLTEALIPKAVSTLDRVLGVWAVGVAEKWDNPIRRKYYGLAGEFRVPKPYQQCSGGPIYTRLEYRTLSNFWLASPAIMCATWEVARQALRFACSDYADAWITNDDETQEAINTCNVKLARNILERNKKVFDWLMAQCGRQEYKYPESKESLKMFYKMSMEGMETLVAAPSDIHKNWALDKEAWQWYAATNDNGNFSWGESAPQTAHMPPVGFARQAEAILGR